MKKVIVILILFINICNADYVSSASGLNKGEAYIKAMSNAPSGNHWMLHDIRYSPSGNTCTIIWKIKK
jgi:hypothetical protein